MNYPECKYCKYFGGKYCIDTGFCEKSHNKVYPNNFKLRENLITIPIEKQLIWGFDEMNDSKTIDVINKPAHYNREGAMQCIEEMLAIFGKEAVMDFCKCNAWKYRYRAADKNGEEDLKKSDVYMKWYKQLKEIGTLILD